MNTELFGFKFIYYQSILFRKLYFQFYTNKRILDKETFDAPTYNFETSIEKAKNIFFFYDYRPERTDLLPYYLRFNIPPMDINDDFDAGSIGGFDGAFSQTRMNRFLFVSCSLNSSSIKYR